MYVATITSWMMYEDTEIKEAVCYCIGNLTDFVGDEKDTIPATF